MSIREENMPNKNNGLRHGENVLLPVSRIPTTKKSSHKTFIVGHSETKHHHVLESKTEFDVTLKDDTLFLELFGPANLVHKKQADKHKTLIVQPGKYQIFRKSEYDPWIGVMREVFD